MNELYTTVRMMKRSLVSLSLILMTMLAAQAQISITTNGQTNYTGANGVSGNSVVTFVVENTNGNAVNLTGLEYYFQVASNNTVCNLWVSSTSLSGAPTVATPTWTNIATSSAIPVPANGYYPVFTTLSYSIPGGTQLRFALQSSINIRYSGATPVPSPSVLSAGGVNLKIGDSQIAGLNIGYGGAFPTPPSTNNPRWFTGGITFSDPANCAAPTAASVSSITTTSASINFTPASGSSTIFYVEYGAPGFSPGSGATAGAGTVVSGASSPISISGLTSGTNYDVYVRENCGAGPVWANKKTSFATACTVGTVPHTQNFSTAIVPNLPPCQLLLDVNGGNTWATATATTPFTNNVIQIVATATAADDWFFLRPLTLTLGQSYRLSFKYGNTSTVNAANLYATYGSSPTPGSQTNSIVSIPSILTGSTVANTSTMDFVVTGATGTYYIGFQTTSATASTLRVDDISVTLTPLCEAPTAVNVSAITASSASVGFTCTTCVGSYVVEVGPTGFTPGTGATAGGGTVFTGASTPITVSGLSGLTNYQVYVRENCGVNGYSANSSAASFTTLCAAFNIPWSDSFESNTVDNGVILPCFSGAIITGTAASTWRQRITPIRNSIGPRTGTDYMTHSFNANSWLFSPGVNLAAGQSYDFFFYYVQTDAIAGHTLNVGVGTTASAAGMTTSLGTIVDVVNTTYQQARYTFVPGTAGVYFFGVQDVSITTTPWYVCTDDWGVEASPACVQPSLPAITGLTPTGGQVNWSCTGCTGSYVVEYGLPGFSPGAGATAGIGGTIVSAPNSPAVLTGLNSNTVYQVYVRQNCTGSSNGYSLNTGPVSFRTLCGPQNIPYFEDFASYADATIPACYAVLDGGSNTTGGIYRWEVDNLLTGTGYGSGVNHMEIYGNQTGSDWFWLPELNLTSGTSYRLRFYVGQSNTTAANQHQLVLAYGAAPNVGSMTNNIATYNLPSGSTNGNLIAYDFVPAATGTYFIGFEVSRTVTNTSYVQIDDISVNLTPACLPVTALSVGSITGTTASISWSCATCPGPYIMEYGAPGFTPGTGATAGTGGTVVTAASSPATITGLSATTNYVVYVRQDCSGGTGGYSNNAGPVAFMTTCPTFLAPYTEDFTSSSVTFNQPTCWANPTPTGGEQWRFATSPLTGNYPATVNDHTTGTGKFAWIDASSDVLPNTLISPIIDISALTQPEAGFWFLANNTNTTVPIVQHGISLQVWDGAAWITMFSYYGNNANWIELKAAIPGGIPAVTQFQIVGERDPANVGSGTYFYKDLFVDDFFVMQAPACPAPTSIATSAITQVGASVSWACVGCTGSYIVEVGATGFTPGTGATAGTGGTVFTASSSPTVVTGLTSNTAYQVYVRQDCSGASNGYSLNAGPVAFTTACSSTNIPYTMDFNGAFNCVTQQSVGSLPNTWVIATAPTGYTGSIGQYSFDVTNPANDWLYMQGLNLTGGTSYRLQYKYGNNSTTLVESMKVAYGTSRTSTAMVNPLADHPTINQNAPQTWIVDFTPATTGVFHIGFHAYSIANQSTLYLDDITVTLTPSCSPVAALMATPSGATTANVSWTCSGCTGSFIVEYGAPGFTPGTGATAGTGGTIVLAGSSPAIISGLSPQTNYQVYVRQDCIGLFSTNSGPISFTTPCVALNIPWSDSFESNTTDNGPILPCFSGEIITGTITTAWRQKIQPQTSSVTIGARTGTDYMTATWNTNSWLFSPGINLSAGQTYQFSFWYAQSSTTAGYTLNAAVGTSNTAAGMSTALGSIVDVVNTSYQKATYTYLAPTAGVYYFGLQEVSTSSSPWYILTDDWTVELPPACPQPSNIVASAIAGTTAQVSWNCPACTGTFIVEYGAPGFTPGLGAAAGTGGTVVTAGTSPVALTGLSPLTAYQVYVRQNCTGSSNGFSLNSGPIGFTTTCPAYTAPYAENFNSAVATFTPPTCWSNPTPTGGEQWRFAVTPLTGNYPTPVNDHTPGGGTKVAWIDASADVLPNTLISPFINMSALTVPEAGFWFLANNTTPTAPVVQHGVSLQVWDGAAWITMLSYYGNNPNWIELKATVPGGVPTSTQFRIVGERDPANIGSGTYFYKDLFVDDFFVKEAPTCPAPSNPVASNVTTTSVDYAWNCTGCSGMFGVIYGPAGFNPALTGTTITPATSPVTIGGLTPNTPYDFYAYQDCGLGDVSDTTFAVSARTLCAPVNVPFFDNFTAYADATIPPCYVVLDGGSNTTGGIYRWEVDNLLTGTGYGSGVNHMEIYGNQTGSDWFWLPELNLTGGTSYRIEFYYGQSTTTAANQHTLTVAYGANATPAAMTTTVVAITVPSGSTAGIFTFHDFTPATTGVYRIGFEAKRTVTNTSYLQVDDIRVYATPSCPLVDNASITVTGVTATTASVNWTCTGCTGSYIVEYGASGFTPGTGATAGTGGTVVTSATSPASISGLTGLTNYQVYVRQDCGLGSISPNRGPIPFTTGCPAFVAPYTEDFTSSSVTFNQPNCWSNPTPAGGEQWRFAASPLTGNYPATVNDHTTGTGKFAWIDASLDVLPNTLISPTIDISALTVPEAGFWFLANNTNTTAPVVQHGISLQVWDGAAWITMFSYYGNNPNWIELTATLPGGIPSTTQFRIVGERDPANVGSGTYFYKDLFVDDFFVREAPTCPAPTLLTVNSVTNTSANVQWSCGSCTGSFIVEYGLSGFTPGTGATAGTGGTIITTATSPVTINGLAGSTNYQVYVRQDCGLGDISFNTGPLAFMSGIDCSTTPVISCGVDLTTTFSGTGNWDNNACLFSTPGQERIFQFTAAAAGTYQLVMNGGTAGYVDWMWKNASGGCSSTGWTCIDDITSTTLSTAFTLPAAGNYLLLADPEATTAYTKTFRIECPATNVSCASATSISCGSSVSGNTIGGTNTLPTTACPFNGAASTGGVNWWVYTATANEDVTASTCGLAAFNTRISVFKPTTNCTDLVCIAQNDDVPGCTSGSSEVTFPVTTGNVYYIAVHGTATGSFTMSLTCAPSCTPASGNATCSSAAPLTTYLADGSGVMMTDDNTCGYSDNPTSCSGANPVQGLWYTFTTSTRTRFRLTLEDNSVNAAYTSTSMSYALYSGACSGNGAGGQIACVAAGAGTTTLPVLQPSTTYRLLVYNTGGTGVQGSFAMLLEYFAENDASIASVLTPSGTICGSQFQSVVVLKNNGVVPLSAVTINANIDGGPTVATVNWTGFLGFGQQTSIVLPVVTTTSGPHVFNVYTSLPNGMTDEIAANDQASSSYDSDGEAVKMHIITDNKGGETTWEIYDDFFLVVANGGPYPNNIDVIENFCLSTDFGSCYYMYLYDSFGDGMCCAFGIGSWELLDAFDKVVLKDDGVFTTQSPALAPFSPSYFAHEFCLPLGPSGPVAGECGVFTNKLLDKVYCKPISGVSTYQFEFSNPNAGFIRRIALPTNYVRFSQMQTNPLVPGTTYFCRVKADQGFIGAFFDDNFGPGCDMGLDPSQVPGCTQLIDNPALPTHSCGVNKQFGGSDKIWAVPVVGASQYRFRFVNASENYVRNITRPSYVCLMSWFTNPLSVGVTYEVTVDVFVNGVWSGFCGNTCMVTVAPNASPVSLREVMETQQSVMLWPNPARADYVQVLVNDMTDETQSIAVDVYDQAGKRVVAQQYQNTGSSFNTVLELNGNMASGMYMVHITVNGELTVEKLTIQ